MDIIKRHRELALASVFALALTGAAGAADMAVKAPFVAPVPVYSWTGFYLGVSGGTGWGTKERSYDQDATLQALFPGFPGAFGRADSSHTINGGFFGGQIGYNYQFGWAVFGIQADWYWADLEGKGQVNTGTFTDLFLGLGTTGSAHSKVNSFGSVTGKLGTALDRTLIYAKAGVAWEDADVGLTLTGPLLCSQFFFVGACNQVQTVGQTRTGFTFGAGIEHAFTYNWTAFVEYNYYDFGTEWVNHNFTIFGNVPVPVNTEVSETFHTIKAGVNYKFNWGAPVVARY